MFRILGLGKRPCVCGVGFRLPVRVVPANLLGIDLAHVLGGGLNVVGSRGKRVPLPLFVDGCPYLPLLGVGPPCNRVRPRLLRSFGLQHV